VEVLVLVQLGLAGAERKVRGQDVRPVLRRVLQLRQEQVHVRGGELALLVNDEAVGALRRLQDVALVDAGGGLAAALKPLAVKGVRLGVVEKHARQLRGRQAVAVGLQPGKAVAEGGPQLFAGGHAPDHVGHVVRDRNLSGPALDLPRVNVQALRVGV